MKTSNEISAYKIYWIEFRAQKGIVTKKDAKILAKFTHPLGIKNHRNLMEHFASKDMALAYLESKTEDFKKLGKAYEVRLCTDKQFSLGHTDYVNNIIAIDFTTKQEQEMFVIGNQK